MSSFAYVWNEYKHYLRRPNPEISFYEDEASPATRFWICVLLSFMLVIPVMAIFGILEQYKLFPDTDEHAVKKMLESTPFPLVFLAGAIIGPIIEELGFRLALVPKKWYFVISSWIVSGYYVMLFYQNKSTIAAAAVLLVLMLLTALMVGMPQQWNYRFQLLYSLHYPYLFYGLALLFAIVHLMNYTLSWQVVLLSPVLVLPQFILGTVLGYLRMRQGMAWAIALHITYNSILLALTYYGMQQEVI